MVEVREVVRAWMAGAGARTAAARAGVDRKTARYVKAAEAVGVVRDRRCRPIAVHTTPGQHADCTGFEQVMASIRIRRRVGRPRTRPGHVLADRAYSSKAIRASLRRRGIIATIPVKADQAANRRRKSAMGGRPPRFDPQRYKQRNTAERCVNKLKQFRAVATRYDKRVYIYRASVDIATMKIWLRDLTRDPRDTT